MCLADADAEEAAYVGGPASAAASAAVAAGAVRAQSAVADATAVMLRRRNM
jgi:hypothetical protein